jgi:defect-in-organelle-trafficking protein DotD
MAIMLAVTTIGCAASTQTKKTPETDPAITALEQSAKQIETDLRQLVLLHTDKKQGGLRAVLPKDGPLGKKIVMKWNGPIEPAIKRIARAIRYKHKTIGTAPAAPITVKVDVVREKAYNVLDSIGWQAANKAQLLVDPLKKRITLAYLPIFGAGEPPSSAPSAK